MQFEAKQAAMPDAELIERCEKVIHDVCETGGKKWTMCVPPQVNDSDMLLCELIRRFKLLTNQHAGY